MTARRYATATAMRTALELRLRELSVASGLPLDRLRKEAALQRLLARLASAAPDGSWALKGGIAMIARAGASARATADADATWRVSRDELRDALDRASELDLHDYFEFAIGQSRPIRGETSEGSLRFQVAVRLASKVFENVRLDVNVVPDDPRPLDEVTLRNLLDFAKVPDVVVPAIRIEQQLAEKLHAYSRDYGARENGRAKDLFDILVIAKELPLPSRSVLTAACHQTFRLRQSAWPPLLKRPPDSWDLPWRGFVTDYRIGYPTLDSAFGAFAAFWYPLINDDCGQVWDPGTWTWT